MNKKIKIKSEREREEYHSSDGPISCCQATKESKYLFYRSHFGHLTLSVLFDKKVLLSRAVKKKGPTRKSLLDHHMSHLSSSNLQRAKMERNPIFKLFYDDVAVNYEYSTSYV